MIRSGQGGRGEKGVIVPVYNLDNHAAPRFERGNGKGKFPGNGHPDFIYCK